MNTMIPHILGITPGLSNTMALGLGLYPDATAEINYDNETATPSPGDTIIGGTSGATGVVIGVSVLIGTQSRQIFMTDVVGTFVDNEAIAVGATAIGLVNGVPSAYDPNNDSPLVSIYLLEQAPNGAVTGKKGDIGIFIGGNTSAFYACDGAQVWRQFTVA